MSTLPNVGDRIELVAMGDDPNPLPRGSKGTVTGVNNTYWGTQISVAWDNGRTLMLVDGEDVWRVIP